MYKFLKYKSSSVVMPKIHSRSVSFDLEC